MSSSRARNFRRRAGDDDDDPNDTQTPTITTTVKSSSKPSSSSSSKPKKPHNQTSKLLSFVDDEEAAPAAATAPSRSSSSKPDKPSRLGKPSSAHKLTALKDRLAHTSSVSTSVPSNVQPQAGTYTKEALRELQKNTRTLASSRPASAATSEPTVVLKGIVKPSDSISATLREARDLDSDGDEEQQRDKDDAEARLGSMGIADKGKPSSGGGLYPDQATINAIRAKRERLRKSTAAAPDFISLDSGSNHGAAEGLSDEEPEFRGRIAMFGDKMEGPKKGVFEEEEDGKGRAGVEAGLRRESVDDEDEDEEDKIWEEEQFRKGLGRRMDDGSVSTSSPVVHSVPQPIPTYSALAGYSLQQSAHVAAPSIGGAAIGASQGSNAMSIHVQAEIAKKALRENVMKLKESHGRTVASLTKTDEHLSASLLNITALEKSLSAADKKYKFMQKLRDFISLICDFLQSKAPFIEELEEEMQKHYEKRASATLERRSADDDEMMEVEAGVKAAMSIFRKEGSSAEIIAAAKSAAQAASASVREQTNLPVKLDEFGRDMNLQKRMDMKGRFEAHQRRKRRYDSKRLSSMEVDSSHRRIEGESSTDESDSESKVYHKYRQMVLDTAGQVFGDAAEEYSQLSMVKERFEEWKREYASSYRDSYMSLSVPAIFSPYVRLELLMWDPLREKTDFLNMSWHSLLMDYGLLEDGSDLESDDADANLVPDLVEKVALPILHHQVAHCWDILSTQETKNAIAATSLVTDYVPSSSEALADLLVAIRTRLADAVTNLTVPTWSPLVLTAVPDAARIAAYRFGMSVRLLRNICLWKEILAFPVLEKLAIEELLCGKVLPHVRSIAANIHDAVTRTERIIASLSGVWAGTNVTGDHSRKLQSLVDFVLFLGKRLEKKHSQGVTQSETSGLARRVKKMLVDLNEYDKARDMARTFNLKEAL